MADSGNYFLDTYGAGAPADAPAPAASAQVAPAPAAGPTTENEPAAPPASSNYFVNAYGPGESNAPPPASPAAPPPPGLLKRGSDLAYAGLQGLGSSYNTVMETAHLAASIPIQSLDKIHSILSGNKHTELQDAWFRNTVDPRIAGESALQVGPDAPFADKAAHAMGGMLGMISQLVLTGPEGAAPAATVTGRAAQYATRGVASMAVPAVSDAVSVGRDVLDKTGDPKAAVTAAFSTYGITSLSGLVRPVLGSSLLARVGSGAVIGGATEEASRVGQNLGMPEDMQQPFSLSNVAAAAIGGAVAGPFMGAEPRAVQEAPNTIMDHAQRVAAADAAAKGGDALDQVGAAVASSTDIGAVHDAVATQVAREGEAAHVQGALEIRRQQAAEADANEQAQIEQGQREQALNQAAKQAAPETTPEQGFQQAEAEQAAAKEKDYTAAKNQVGEQAVEAAKTEDIGAEKGGANEPKPTLAEALPPEQLAALQSLKERRAAEAAKTSEQPAPEPTVAERLEQQNPEDNFQKLGPEVAPAAEVPHRLEARRRMAAQTEDEMEAEAAERNPAPQTPQTLAERRQAAVDAAWRAKVRGSGENPAQLSSNGAEKPVEAPTEAATPAAEASPPEAAPLENAGQAPAGEAAEPKSLETAQPKDLAAAPTPVAAPNRLAAIRAAAEKRQNANLPDAARELINEQRAGRGKPPLQSQGIAADVDRMLKGRMSHAEAKGHLADVSDAAAPRSFQVHESSLSDTVPENLRPQIRAALAAGKNIKGVYDAGVAHVFADGHAKGDKEDILSTSVHELAHKGLDSFLGPKLDDTLNSIHADIKDTAWAKKLLRMRTLDPKNPHDQRVLANEYMAHMAENIAAGREVHADLPVKDRVAGHWQNVVDSIRAGLRQIGLVKHWNDNDIAALIRQSTTDNASRAAREGIQYKQSGGALFSQGNLDDYMEDHFAPDHPNAIGHKLARTVEEQGKYNPGFVKRATDLAKDLRDKAPDHILGGIGLRNIPDFISHDKMPSARAFIDAHDSMEGRRRQVLQPTIDLAKDWSQWQAKQPDRGEFLSDLMHSSTLFGHDPSKPYVERYTPEARAADPAKAQDERYQRNIHRSLRDEFNKLDDKGREIFNRVRDSYDDQRTRVLNGLEDRINSTGADDTVKKNAIASLRKTFESGKVKGAYFPLQRFGDLWANAKDEKGETAAFARFESRTQRKQWLAQMRQKGFDVDSGERMDQQSEMSRISPEFVKNVLGHVQAADPSGQLAKDVWQEYLKAMPEMSMRKHSIARVGRLGFSSDALRAYAYNSFHGAHQLARLEYGNKLDTHLENIKNEARSMEQAAAQNPDDAGAQSDAKWAPAIAREMAQRLDWINNPRSSKLASAMTRFGFSWYLGAAPATAFRIFSQNPMLAAPMLAKHFGWTGASKELSRASFQWAKARGYLGLGDQLRGDERKAFQEANDRGLFSDTNTQTMAAGGDGSPLFQGPWYQFQKYAGYMFNAMEHHNRMTTHLAAYRLGKMQGMDHDTASSTARNLTWDSHFDYTNANRPRYLQGSIPKVIGLFKQYSLGVTYRLAREGADLINSEKSIPERGAAAVALGSLIGRMMLFAGATGVPGYWIAEKLMNTWQEAQDGQPYDMTAALHKHLSDTMGTTAADSIMTGPIGALTGASLSSGASYNDLWYKEPLRSETPQAEMYDALGQLMGPIAALPINATQGLGQIYQGNVERGLEHFLPPEAAALAKAFRYSQEGVQTTSGENMLPPGEEITNKDIALQALGFTPQKVADAQRRTAALKNVSQAIEDKRRMLSGQYESALLVGDTKTVEELGPKIEAFNAANPGLAIGKGVMPGVMSLAKRRAGATQGVNLPPGLQGLEEKY